MGNKEYLNVNELATLFGLNVQTLHYYDKIGILKPNYRDPHNGYRKYRFDQTYKLASIRYMRKLGYSIDAVRDFQDTKDPDEALKRLKERSAAIHAQWEEMMRIDHAILRKIQFIEDSKKGVDYEDFQVVKYPERKYITIGTETEIYAGESFYFYPTIVFYGKNKNGEIKKEFGALLTDDSDAENAETLTIPAGTYVVGYHKGAYEQIQDSFDRIKRWGRNLNLEDTILAVNIIDQFVEQNNGNYSTRIEVRIAGTH